jgi:amidase
MTARASHADDSRGVDRRTFLRVGALGGAAAAAGASLGANATASAPESPPASPPVFDLEETTITDLAKKMASGEESARSLAEKYIARIESFDRRGPALRSILEVNPDALSIAEALDAERRAGKLRGPLHGVPILLKDNIGTADRMETTAGSLLLVGAKPSNDAFVAQRLRQAGAVILGKTNLSEWANFRSTHSSSGWSARGGQCRNPYALDRTPSGSSSGSAVAAAANLCAAAIGTETDGSIVSPASCNSLVGVKPTVGLVSRTGIVPIAHSQDTAGPMARCVADAAILLSAIAGPDPADRATRAASERTFLDPTSVLAPDGLAGARIGVVRKSLFGYSPAADRLAEEAVTVLRELGAVVVDPADIATVDDFQKPELEVLLYEFKADLEKYLASLGGGSARTLADLIRANDARKGEELPYFGQEIFEMAQKKGPLSEKAYRDALAANLKKSRKQGIDAALAARTLDALVAPTGSPPGLIDLVNGDAGGGGSSTLPAVAGYPHVTVPMGYAFGLPVGLSFIGGAWSERVLLKFAYAFEQATRHRRPPRLLATANL